MEVGTDLQLETLGLNAAKAVIGDGVEQVLVQHGQDSTMAPSYVFFFLIDHYRAGQNLGQVRLRLIQRLRDDLLARGDHHHAAVQMLDHADWSKVRHVVAG